MNRREFIKISSSAMLIPSFSFSFKEKRSSFIDYARKNFKINDYKHGIINFEPTANHYELANIYDNQRFVLTKKYRQGGFSTMTLLWSIHQCLINTNYSVLYLVKTDREAVYAKTRIIDCAINLMSPKPKIIKNNGREVIFGNGSNMCFSRPIAACGKATNCIIIDEAAFIPSLEKHFKALWSLISTGGKLFMVSTPNGTHGFFYDSYKQALQGQNKFFVYAPSCYDHPWYNTPEKIAELKHNLGEKGFRQECEALFQDEPY